ncbi:MAG: hypothetical protein IT381_32410 [Deltaproteobacteria bacterium]|nr:hypothetical protein [Deltaproteobacteria bacterium]
MQDTRAQRDVGLDDAGEISSRGRRAACFADQAGENPVGGWQAIETSEERLQLGRTQEILEICYLGERRSQRPSIAVGGENAVGEPVGVGRGAARRFFSPAPIRDERARHLGVSAPNLSEERGPGVTGVGGEHEHVETLVLE